MWELRSQRREVGMAKANDVGTSVRSETSLEAKPLYPIPHPASPIPLYANEVPPTRLRPVQCLVRTIEQIFCSLDLCFGEISNADADR